MRPGPLSVETLPSLEAKHLDARFRLAKVMKLSLLENLSPLPPPDVQEKLEQIEVTRAKPDDLQRKLIKIGKRQNELPLHPANHVIL